ncbi:MAG: hypothetical protein RLZZ516_253 [Cyanobacteriota bacterium]
MSTTAGGHRPQTNRPQTGRPQNNRPTRPTINATPTATPTPAPSRPGGAEHPSWEELFGRR